MHRLLFVAALIATLCLASCGGEEPARPSNAAPVASPQARALLDSWQGPILRTLTAVKRRKAADLRGDRAAVDRITEDVVRATERVLALSRDGRLFAASVRDDRLAGAITRAGDSWAFWADAVARLRPVRHITAVERRAAAALADLGLAAIRDFGAAYRAAGAEPPAAFRIG